MSGYWRCKVYITSFVLFALFGCYGLFRDYIVVSAEHLEHEQTILGWLASIVIFFSDIEERFSFRRFSFGERIAALWQVVMWGPEATKAGIRLIRDRQSPDQITVHLAAKLYNEMAADQLWRPLPDEEPYCSAAVLLVEFELVRCTPNKQSGGFDIRVPSKKSG